MTRLDLTGPVGHCLPRPRGCQRVADVSTGWHRHCGQHKAAATPVPWAC